MAPPRVRMAPSPTGWFHLGSARTTLYNWLFARQLGGTFILRIEDTDEERNRPEWYEAIEDAIRWLGLDWDEYHRQSTRGDLYAVAGEKLAASGAAYWCACTREEIDARAKARGGAPGYDGHCRDLGLERAPGRALRFRTPREGVTVVHDVVRGDPEFANATLEDFSLQRADGSALFILANVVDDGDMAISHVIRGEDHLPNTPKYLLLWDALGYGPHPVFAHLPMIVNEARKKMSKRKGDPVSLELYRDAGYLPEVMVNYLALVGWAPPDGRERLTLDELVAAFRLEDVGSSPGFFDVVKLRAFNGDTLRAMSTEAFTAAALPHLETAPWADRLDPDVFARVAPLVQERVSVLSEVAAMVDFLFLDEPEVDEASWQKAMATEVAAGVLDATIAGLDALGDDEWAAEPVKEAVLAAGDAHGLKLAKAQAPVRVAITGRTVGPPLFESMEVLGRAVSLVRLRAARARL